MLWNFLATAARNLGRNRAHAAVGIGGLALGLCAALCAGLVLRDQLGYERFIQGYQRTYVAVSVLFPRGRAPVYGAATHNSVAGLLQLRFPEIASATRLADESVTLRHGQVAARETLYWADPNVFSTLPLPSHAGDLKNALRRPDSIVLSRSAALKYFGREDPIGATLEVERHPLTVTAVIEDLPPHGTQLESGIFASGAASFSRLSKLDADPDNSPESSRFLINVTTFLRLTPGAAPERIQQQMPKLMNAIWPRRPPGLGATMQLVRIDQLHLFPGLNPDVRGRLTGSSLIGALILLLACINFVNLTTARWARRAMEVGIRKACGAGRGAVIAQFLTESLLHVALACGLAIVMAEWCLPYINAFLDTNIATDYWRSPVVVGWIVLGVLVLALLAGSYPAFIVSAFRPASVLRGTLHHPRGAGRVWQGLVILQFAVLIGLMIAAGVIYQQKIFATRNVLRVATDQILLIRSSCANALENELRRLPGVRGVGCSSESLLNGQAFDNVRLKDGGALAISVVSIDPGVLELYGLQPVAGRFFHTRSDAPDTGSAAPSATIRLLINQTAVAGLGFPSAAAAVGQPLKLSGGTGEIIGVVPDFTLDSVKEKIKATLYQVRPGDFSLITVNLTGQDIPETLEQIDRVWARTGASRPITRYFLSDYIQSLYVAVLREAQMFGIFAVIAILLASLGLFALTAAITERRTKEIGIRKAMGAGTRDIARLLVWQFTKPALWANVIAWPVGAYLMGRWLLGFAYHTDLSPWLFVGSALIAIAVAQLTVATHCYLVARSNPVVALRFE